MSASKTAYSARLEETDLLRLRHMLGGMLVAVALWGIALIEGAATVEAVVALVVVLVGLAVPAWLTSRGERFWSRAGWGVVLFAVADLGSTGIADKSRIIPAIIRVAMVIVTLRSLQPRSRREDMQLILLALFLCAVSGALSLSPSFAVQVFVFIPLAGGILFLLNRLEGAPRTKLGNSDWENFRWRTFFARIRATLTPATLLFFSGALTAVIVWGSVIFWAMPRWRMDHEVPFLKFAGKGRTGFSDNVSLGGIGEINRDDSVALRADTPGRARPVANLYWRMIALDAYRGSEGDSGFSLSPSSEAHFRENTGQGPVWSRPEDTFSGSAKAPIRGDWRVFMEGNVSMYLPVPGLTRGIRFDKSQEWRENSRLRVLRLRETPSAGTAMLTTLLADSSQFVPSPREKPELEHLVAASEKYPGTLLALPKDEPSRAKLSETVADFSATPLTAPEFCAKAGEWLQRRHTYALQDGYGRKSAPSGEPRDYIVRWMHSEATGWCEHFATSFVLLARAAGHPARLVTGFSGGEWNESEQYLVVRMRHAHAWAEVYDRASGLWMRVDPTPNAAVGPEGAATDRSLAGSFSGLNAWYDSLTMLWFRRVVNFDEAGREETLRDAAGRAAAWGRAVSETLSAWRVAMVEKLRECAGAPAKIVPFAAFVALVGVLLWAAIRFVRRLSVRGVRGAGAGDPRVRRFRDRAGRALARIDRETLAGRRVDAGVRAAVEIIRFGAPATWPDPVAALASVSPALRRARRKG